MVRVGADAEVEGFLTTNLDEVPNFCPSDCDSFCSVAVSSIFQFDFAESCERDVDSLVGANTCGLKSLGTQLLVLVGDEVNAERELIDVGSLASEIEDTLKC